MHVDVDQLGSNLQKKRHHRMTIVCDEVLVGAAHRAMQQPIAYRPVVDEQELQGRAAAVKGRQPGEAVEPEILALGLDRDGIGREFLTEDGLQAPQPAAGISGGR
jgi:hypothetical protein